MALKTTASYLVSTLAGIQCALSDLSDWECIIDTQILAPLPTLKWNGGAGASQLQLCYFVHITSLSLSQQSDALLKCIFWSSQPLCVCVCLSTGAFPSFSSFLSTLICDCDCAHSFLCLKMSDSSSLFFDCRILICVLQL